MLTKKEQAKLDKEFKRFKNKKFKGCDVITGEQLMKCREEFMKLKGIK